jgi:DNA-binding NarL/FixJ family response regulator
MVIRLLICDDHPVVRAGLRAVLETAPDITVIGEAANAAEAVEHANTCDVVTMDLNLGDNSDGVHATAQIRALPHPPAVLVLTNYDTDAKILAAVEAGALGYLLKDAEPDALISAVKRAARGETVLEPRLLAKLTQEVQRPKVTLTAREQDVLNLLKAGQKNTEIADHLHVSTTTVKSHLAAIYSKLGVSSRTAAVAKARSRDL